MSKTLVIIGAGPGLSLETARRFAREGYDVVLASRHPENLGEHLTSLRQHGTTITTEVVDAADGASITALVERYAEKVDVLLYNAAVIRFGVNLADVPANALDEDIQIDLSSALRAIKGVLPSMLKGGQGTILLTSGAITDYPNAEALTLSAGKAGLLTAARAMFETLKASNVQITALTVGALVQPGSDNAREIAESYWQITNSPQQEWTWERRYSMV